MARCTICTHPHIDAINLAIRTKTAHTTIAQEFGVSRDSVRRHALSHLPEAAKSKRAARADSSTHRARTPGQHIPPEQISEVQRAFLNAYVRECNESAACRIAHIDRSTVRNWEEHSDEFKFSYHEARRQVDDAIDGEIARRALYGVAEPVVSAGKVIYNSDGSIMTVQKYSDRMLELLAKAHHAKYREKSQVDLTSNGQTVGQGVSLGDVLVMQEQVAAKLRAFREGHAHDDDLHAH